MATTTTTIETEAFVTLATNDVYAVGAVVWAHSLRRQNTTRKIVAIVTPGVTADMQRQMQVRGMCRKIFFS